jgi:hypothetical protein
VLYPGPSSCLYSPECVEGEFPEVRMFAFACAGVATLVHSHFG